MPATGTFGTVHELWRFPVKSMAGEKLEEVEVTARGFLGDRAHALIDVETGKVVSAKREDVFPGLLDCRATYVETPRTGRELPPIRITLSNGPVTTSDSPDVDRTLSEYFRRDVRLARSTRDAAPEERLHPKFLANAGFPSPPSVSPFVDLYPMTVMTTATLARLSELAPDSRIDARRFRMNVIVETAEGGFPENDWIGRDIALGDAVRLTVALPDPRCVMTNMAQDGLPKDSEVLRTMAKHNTLPIGEAGPYPCAGVYAIVGTGGILQTRSAVVVI